MLHYLVMLTYPNIDPVLVKIGPFFGIGPISIHWYGLMYVIGFIVAIILLKRRARNNGWRGWTPEQAEDMIFVGLFGVILGGRLGYFLFYQPSVFWTEPLTLIKFQQGGMSFHGGLIGVIIAMGYYAVRNGRTLFEVTDFLVPAVAPGLGFGRIGNFINGELWGKQTDLPWGMLHQGTVKHPSMLYEALLEGLVLFIILWWYSSKPRAKRSISGLFLLLYGIFRFMVEFVRVPDAHIGYQFFGWMTRGHQLSIPMIIIGVYLIYSSKNYPHVPSLDSKPLKVNAKV